jgi:DhnA family fructose-bisphosphate aldolase class Ia
MGAVGMVISFLLGYEEAIEAACLKAAVQLSLAGKDLGLPLVVEVRPSGPRVSLPAKAIELGASYALESGADVIIVPYPGLDSLKTISVMLSVPWLLKPTSVDKAASEWEEGINLGATGLWLDHAWLEPASPLKQFSDRLHQLPEKAK